MSTTLRARAGTTSTLALLALLCGALAPACSCGGRAPQNLDREVAEGRRVITGTVLDAATHVPVKGAEVSAPGASHVKSDAAGRFSVEVALEASGQVTAQASQGRTGSVRLRPGHEGGPRRLEVVLYVAP